jgi:hypothetical protein
MSYQYSPPSTTPMIEVNSEHIFRLFRKNNGIKRFLFFYNAFCAFSK